MRVRIGIVVAAVAALGSMAASGSCPGSGPKTVGGSGPGPGGTTIDGRFKPNQPVGNHPYGIPEETPIGGETVRATPTPLPSNIPPTPTP
jgi:hypothetical protein